MDAVAASNRALGAIRLAVIAAMLFCWQWTEHPHARADRIHLTFAVAAAYAGWTLASKRGRSVAGWQLAILDLVVVTALIFQTTDAQAQLRPALLFVPLGAALVTRPRRTALVAAACVAAALMLDATADASSAGYAARNIFLFHLGWASVAAVVLSSLL
jgi:hypothetical protein